MSVAFILTLFFNYLFAGDSVEAYIKDGANDGQCTQNSPCESMTKAVGLLKTTGEVSLKIDESANAESNIIWNFGTITITSSTDQKANLKFPADLSVDKLENGIITVTTQTALKIINIKITVPSQFNDVCGFKPASLVSFAGSSMTLENSEFDIADNLDAFRFIEHSGKSFTAKTMSIEPVNSKTLKLAPLSFTGLIGEITFEDCSFKKITIEENKAAISINVHGGIQVNVKGSTFEDITSSSIEGGAIAINGDHVSTKVYFDGDNANNFARCSCQGKGGAIFLSTISSNDIKIDKEKNIFDANVAQVGKNFYFKVNDVTDNALKTNLQKFITEDSQADGQFFVCGGATYQYDIDLYYVFHKTKLPELYISSNGLNPETVQHCGLMNYPCSVLGKAFDSHFIDQTQVRMVKILTSANMIGMELKDADPASNDDPDLSKNSITFVGTSTTNEKSILIFADGIKGITDNSAAVVAVITKEVAFQKLKIKLSKSASGSPEVLIGCGITESGNVNAKVTLQECILTADNAITAVPILKAAKGTVIISQCTFGEEKLLTFGASPFLLYSSINFNQLLDINVKNIKAPSVFKLIDEPNAKNAFSNEITKIEIQNSVFESITASESGMIHIQSTKEIELSITKCKFDTISTIFGAVYLKKEDGSKYGAVAITESSFTALTATNEGGAIHFDATSSFTMNNVIFEKCGASYGGAIYYTIVDALTDTQPFKKVLFVDNFVADHTDKTKQGFDVCCMDTAKNLQGNPFDAESVTNAQKNWFYHQDKHEEWPKYGPLVREVDLDNEHGKDDDNCGFTETTRCKTIKIAMEKSFKFRPTVVSLLIGTYTHDDKTLSPAQGVSQTIRGASKSSIIQVILEEDSKSLFAIGDGCKFGLEKLTLMHMSTDKNNEKVSLMTVTNQEAIISLYDVAVKADNAHKNTGMLFNAALFSISDGSVTFDSVSVDKFYLRGFPVIQISDCKEIKFIKSSFSYCERDCSDGASVIEAKLVQLNSAITIDGCSFKNNTAKISSKGGAVYISADASSKVSILGKTTFTNCSCEKGRGGAIYMDLSSASTLKMEDTITFTTNKAALGSDMWIHANDLRPLITADKVPKVIGSVAAKLRMGDDTYTGDNGIDLSFFYTAFTKSNNVAVSSSDQGNDGYDYCGGNVYPCKTLSFIMNNRHNKNGEQIFTVINGANMESALTWSLAYKFTSVAGSRSVLSFPASLNVYEKDGEVMLIRNKITFDTISINIPNAFSSTCKPGMLLKGDTSANVVFNDVYISGGGLDMPFKFGVFSKGSVSFTLFKMNYQDGIQNNAISFDESPFIFEENAKITTMKDIKLDSISIKKGSLFELNGNSFTCNNLEAKSVTGTTAAVFYDKKGASTVSLSDCKFDECKSNGENAKGGAIGFEKSLTSLTIQNSEFTTCTTSKSGGAIYVSGITTTFNFNNIKFTTCKADENGGAVFVSEIPATSRFTDVTFSKCNAAKGGALYMTNINNDLTVVATMVFLSNEGATGVDVYIQKPAAIQQKWFASSWTTTKENSLIINENGNDNSFNWISYRRSTYKVNGMDGKDDPDKDGCKLEDETKDCKTIGRGVSILANNVKAVIQVVYMTKDGDKERYYEEKKPINDRIGGFILRPFEGPNKIKVRTNFVDKQTALFVISCAGGVTIENFDFTHYSSNRQNRDISLFDISGNGELNLVACDIHTEGQDHTPIKSFTTQVFSVTGGTLTLSDSKVSGFHLNGSPLIAGSRTTATTYNFRNTEFSNIHLRCSVSGEASVISIGSDSKVGNVQLNIDGCTFDECVSQESVKGGAICFISTSETHLLKITNTNNFHACEAQGVNSLGGAVYVEINKTSPNTELTGTFGTNANSASDGKTLFVKAPDLKTFVTEKMFTPAHLSNEMHQMVGLDTPYFKKYPVDLYSLFTEFTDTDIYVTTVNIGTTDPVDAIYCGPKTYPCKTFSHVIEKHLQVGQVTNVHIEQLKNHSLEKVLTISGRISFDPIDSKSSATIIINPLDVTSDDAAIVTIDAGSLKFDMIDFVFPKTITKKVCMYEPTSVFRIQENGHLTIQNSKFNFSSGSIMSMSLVKEINGNLDLDGVILNVSTTYSVPPFDLGGVSNIKNCKFLRGTFKLMEEGLIALRHDDDAKTGPMSAKCVIEDCTFSGMTSIGGTDKVPKGTAIYVEEKVNGLNIKTSTFANLNCTSESASKDGLGGAIYSKLCSSLSIEDCTFSQCTAGSNGGSIYMETTNNVDCLSIDRCVFESNIAKLGGGIYMLAKDASMLQKKVKSVFNKNVGSVHGDDVYLEDQGTSIGDENDKSPFIESISSNNEEKRLYYKNGANEGNKKMYIGNDVRNRLADPTQNGEGAECGLSGKTACKSIFVGVDVSLSWTPCTVTLAAQEFHNEDKTIIIGGKLITIEGKGATDTGSRIKTSFTTKNTYLFQINAGSLTTRGSIIYHDWEKAELLECGLFNVAAGELNVENCVITPTKGQPLSDKFKNTLFTVSAKLTMKDTTIEQFKMEHSSIITLQQTGASVALTSCAFMKISCCGGDQGSVISCRGTNGATYAVEINKCTFNESSSPDSKIGGVITYFGHSDASVFKIDRSTKFVRCGCDEDLGKGGAIYLQLSNWNNVNIQASSYSYTSAKYGSDIFIKSNDLRKVIIPSVIGSDVVPSTKNGTKMGEDDYTGDTPVDLYYYYSSFLKKEQVHISVADRGNDNYEYCGDVTYPCSSMKFIMNNRFAGAGEKVFLIINRADVETQLSWKYVEGVKFTRYSVEEATLEFKSDLRAAIKDNEAILNNGKMTFESIKLTFPDKFDDVCALARGSLITSDGASASLTLRDINMNHGSTGSEIGFVLLNIKSGSVLLDNVNVERTGIEGQLKFLTSPIIMKKAVKSHVFNNLIFSNIFVKETCLMGIDEMQFTITNSKFTSISSKDDSSVFSLTGTPSVYTISGCTFTGCVGQAKEGRGGAIGVKGAGGLTISKCEFSGCSVTGEDHNEEDKEESYGGAICVVQLTTTLSITDSTFTSCDALHKGGAIYLEKVPTGTKIENTVINVINHVGVTDLKGWGLYWVYANKVNTLLVTFKGLEDDQHYVHLFDNTKSLVESPFKDCYSDHKTGNVKLEVEGKEPEQKEHWMKYMRSIYNVDSKVENDDSCKAADAADAEACRHIHTAIDLIVGKVGTVTCKTGTYDEELTSFAYQDKSVSILGETKAENCILKTMYEKKSDEAFFHVSANMMFGISLFTITHNSSKEGNRETSLFTVDNLAKLTLTNIILDTEDVHQSSKSFTVSMFNVHGGDIELTSVSIRNFNLKYNPLISGNREGALALKLKNVNINNVNLRCSVQGDASIMSVISTDAQPVDLTVDSCTFTECTAQESAKGGAVSFISSSALSKLTLTNTISSSNCKAEGQNSRGGAFYIDVSVMPKLNVVGLKLTCNGNQASQGKTLFVKGIDLRNNIQKVFKEQIFSHNLNEMVGLDEKGVFTTVPVDLYSLYDHYSESNVYIYDKTVDQSIPNDDIYCGPQAYPCQSFSYGMEHLSGTGTIHLGKAHSFNVNSPYVFNNVITINSVDNDIKTSLSLIAKKTVENDEAGFFTVHSQLTVNYVTVKVPNSFTDVVCRFEPAAVFTVDNVNGILIMNHVQFSGDTIPIRLIKETKGDVQLTNVELQQVTCTLTPFVFFSKVKMTSCNYISVTVKDDQGLMLLKNDKDDQTINANVAISNCLFEKCICSGSSKENGKGAALCTEELVGALTISDCTFKSCSVNGSATNAADACGGALYLNKVAALKIIGSTFQECSSKMHAGAIYIIASSKADIVQCKFIKNSASNGGAFYFKSDSCATYAKNIKSIFESNTATNHGIDVYMKDEASVNSDVDSPFYDSLTNSVQENRVFYENGQVQAVKKTFISDDIRKRNANEASTYEGDDCGLAANKDCKTIKLAVDKSLEWCECTVNLVSNAFLNEHETIDIGAKQIMMQASSKNVVLHTIKNHENEHLSLLKVNKGQLTAKSFIIQHDTTEESNRKTKPFDLQDGTMIFDSITFQPDDKHSHKTKLEVSLFEVTKGHLNLISCTVKSFLSTSTPLFRLVGATAADERVINLEGTTFSSISRCGGDGGCIVDSQTIGNNKYSLTLKGCTFSEISSPGSSKGGVVTFTSGSAAQKFHIYGTTFTKCSCSENGKGGAFYISLGSSEFSIDAASRFTENKAKIGYDFFIECNDLRRVIVNEIVPKTLVPEPVTNAKVGIDKYTGEKPNELSYYYTTFKKQASVHVSVADKGRDGLTYCGDSLYPCETLKYIISDKFDMVGEQTFLIVTNVKVQNGIDWKFTEGVKFASSNGRASTRSLITFEGSLKGALGDDAAIMNRAKMTFDYVRIDYPNSFTDVCSLATGALISTDGATSSMIMKDVQFIHPGTDEITFAILNAKGGLLSIDSLEVVPTATSIAKFTYSPIKIHKEVNPQLLKSITCSFVTIVEESLFNLGERSYNFQSCSFNSITSTKKSSVFSISGANMEISIFDCKFSGCANTEKKGKGGAIYCEKTAKSLVINGGQFIGCGLGGEESIGGGALYLEGVTSKFELVNVQFSGSDISVGKRTDGVEGTRGGAMYWEQIPDGCTISSVTISQCKAHKGSGIYWEMTKPHNGDINIVFDNNKDPSENGKDVYLLDKLANKLTASPFLQSWTTVEDGYVYHEYKEEHVQEPHWIKKYRKSFIVDPKDGHDIGEEKCVTDNSEFRCKTIHKALTIIPTKVGIVECKKGSYIEEVTPFTFNDNTISIQGNGPKTDDNSTLYTVFETVQQSAFFAVSGTGKLTLSQFYLEHDSTKAANRETALFEVSNNGEITLQKMTISSDDEHVKVKGFTKSLFSVKGGSLSLDGIEIKGFNLYGVPLMEVNSASSRTISLKDSEFNNIQTDCNVNGESSIMTCVSTEEAPIFLTINKCTFTNCKSPQSNKGGAISYISQSTNGMLKLSGDLSFAGCDCSSSDGYGAGLYLDLSVMPSGGLTKDVTLKGTGKAKHGTCLFLKVSSLLDYVTEDVFGAGYFSKTHNVMVGLDSGNIFNVVPIDLYSLIENYVDDDIYVMSTNPRDDIWCGPEYYPCLTLPYAMTHGTANTVIHIESGKSFTLEQAYVFTKGLKIVSTKTDTPATIKCQQQANVGEDDGGYLTVSGSSLTIENIIIESPIKFSKGLCFDQAVAVFRINANGNLRLNKVKFSFESNTNIEIMAIIQSKGSSLTMTDCVVGGQTSSTFLQSVIEIGGTATLSKCEFTNIECKSNRGVLNLVREEDDINKPVCKIEQCKFTTCKCSSSLTGDDVEKKAAHGGAISVDSFYNTLDIIGGEFTHCEVTGTKAKGGAIYCHCRTRFSMTSVTVDSCSSSDEAGAVYIIPPTPTDSSLSIQLCKFKSNKASQKGGAFYMLAENAENDKSKIRSFFEGNTAPKGMDAYIEDTQADLPEDGESSPFYPSLTSTNDNNRVKYYGSSKEEHDRPKYIGMKDKVRNADQSKENEDDNCGLKNEVPCKSIKVAVEKSIDWTQGTVLLLSPVFDKEKETIEVKKQIVIEGKGTANTAIHTIFENEKSVMFSVLQNGEMSIKKATILHNSQEEKCRKSTLVNVNGGTCMIEDCMILPDDKHSKLSKFETSIFTVNGILVIQKSTIKSFITQGVPLISLNGINQQASIYESIVQDVTCCNGQEAAFICSHNENAYTLDVDVSDSTFTKVTSPSSQKGGVFTLHANSADSKVSFGGNTKFEECYCNSVGMGGAIYLESRSLNVKFEKSVTFTKCDAGIGKDLYIDYDDLRYLVVAEHIPQEFVPSTEENMKVGKDKFIPKAYDLWYYYTTFTKQSHVHVSSMEKGMDDKTYCGDYILPCKTLKFVADNRFDGVGEQTFEIVDEVSSDASMKWNYAAGIKFTTASEQMGNVYSTIDIDASTTVASKGDGAIQNTATMTIEKVIIKFRNQFTFSCGFLPESVISTAGTAASLTLSKCEFKQDGNTNEMRFAIIHAKSGVLSVTDCSLTRFGGITESVFEKNAFVIETATNVKTFASVTVRSVKINEGSLFNLVGPAKLEMNGCVFESITSKVQGSVFALKDGETVTIHNCKFDRCCNTLKEKAVGGAISCSGTSGSLVIDQDSAFSGCTVKGKDCFGGAIAISSIKQSLKLHRVSFSACTALSTDEAEHPAFGGAIYLSGYPASVELAECSFAHNRADDGGAIYMIYEAIANLASKFICLFVDENEATVHGHDVYLKDMHNEAITQDQNSPFYKSMSTRQDESRLYYVTSAKPEEGAEKKSFIGDDQRNRYVSKDSKFDEPTCGLNENLQDKYCRTIGVAVSYCSDWTQNTIHIMEGDSLSETATIAVGAKFIVVQTAGKESTIIRTSFAGENVLYSIKGGSITQEGFIIIHDQSILGNRHSKLFAIEGGEATLTDFDVRKDAEKKDEQYLAPLFEVKGGSLNIKEMKCNSMSFKDSSIICLSEGDKRQSGLSLNKCEFSKIERVGSNGASVINADVKQTTLSVQIVDSTFDSCVARESTTGGAICLKSEEVEGHFRLEKSEGDGCKFTSCECSTTKGSGGAIYLDFQNKPAEIIITSFEKEEGDDKENKASKGQDLYVYLDDLTKRVVKPLINIDLPEKQNKMVGKDCALFKSNVVDLYLFDNFHFDTVYVDSRLGEDDNFCGLKSHPCKTFDKAYAQKKVGQVTFSIVSGYNVPTTRWNYVEHITIDSSLKPQAFADFIFSDSMEVAQEGDPAFAVQKTLTLSYLDVTYPNKFRDTVCNYKPSALIGSYTDGSSLSVSHCEFYQEEGKVGEPVEICLISSVGGTVSIEASTFVVESPSGRLTFNESPLKVSYYVEDDEDKTKKFGSMTVSMELKDIDMKNSPLVAMESDGTLTFAGGNYENVVGLNGPSFAIIETKGTLAVSGGNFKKCENKKDNGGLFRASTKKNPETDEDIKPIIKFTGGVFTECKASAANCGGGVLYANDVEQIQFSSSRFEKCSAANGGALNLVVLPAASVLKGISFIENTATNGGAMHITLKDTVPEETNVLCYFEKNTKTGKGSDVYVDDQNENKVDIQFFKKSMTTDKNANTLYHHHKSGDDETKGYIPYGEATRVIAIDGGNEEDDCGFTGKVGCKSIEVAFKKFGEGLPYYAKLVKGTYKNEKGPVSTKGGDDNNAFALIVGIVGESKDETTFSTSYGDDVADGMFLVNMAASSLSFSKFTIVLDSSIEKNRGVPLVFVSEAGGFGAIDCVFKPDNAHKTETAFTSYIFRADQGSISFTDCVIQSIKMSEKSLIFMNNTSSGFTLKNTDFKSISLTGESNVVYVDTIAVSVKLEGGSFVQCVSTGKTGSALRVVIASAASNVVIKETRFEMNENDANEGQGAAVYLEAAFEAGYNSVGVATVPVTLSLATFKDNKGKVGKNIFIKVKDLDQITDSMFDLDLSDMYEKENLINAQVGDEEVTDLLMDESKHQIPYKTNEVVLSSLTEAEEGKRCGSIQHPCNSWDLIQEHITSTDEQTVKIKKQFLLHIEATTTHPFVLTSTDDSLADVQVFDRFTTSYESVFHPISSFKMKNIKVKYPPQFIGTGTRVKAIVIGSEVRASIDIENAEFGPTNAATNDIEFSMLTVKSSLVKTNVKNTIFTGLLSTPTTSWNELEEESLDEAAVDGVCVWKSDASLVRLQSASSAKFESVSFVSSISGGISVVEKSSAQLVNVKFLNNNPKQQKYPSLRHNIICQGTNSDTKIVIDSLQAGSDGTGDSDFWMVNDGCDITGEGLPQKDSLFFVPTLKSATSPSFDGAKTTITFTGTKLIPCGLGFDVAQKTGEKIGTWTHVNGFTDSVSDTVAKADVDTKLVDIGDADEVVVRLTFGDNKATNDVQLRKKVIPPPPPPPPPHDDPEKPKNKPKLSGGAIAGIIIGVLAVVGVAVAVVIICVVKKRKSGGRSKSYGGTSVQMKGGKDSSYEPMLSKKAKDDGLYAPMLSNKE
ncbi:uncharacterized protein MONOS_336 [Monocercomonoides exilis]|uniref:uncharacterized protein n=1 Tax=Monocercomonoides exilis TaxID=2049356 RepID=UPI00355A1942|nr:hypothetical protein MONOS_336 [Monocercomonoides exilis]|eukprot:MONOS_336.1-p1 / transcript=MONOS_336.1 / gene=MONOS_336 / organism=Monocercomonoides_exilis_PA203 / gene_product=unspecified product / transcript_product=unspecified product / location=Mono_scaffold00005:231847-255660(+) / protein_length=7938 / sequence_SO=supercontig / SO=protein_coding / is_pseudo=false